MYKVLLVDDEPWSLVSLKNAFNWNAYGFEVAFETTSPSEAYRLICDELIHIVFLDIRMPEISGLDLISMVRDEGIDVDFVIVSGFDEFSYAQQALKDGVLDYCLKPVQPDKTDDLLKKLSDHLESKHTFNDVHLYEKLLECSCSINNLLKTRKFKSIYRYFRVIAVKCSAADDYAEQVILSLYGNKLKLQLGLGKYSYIINDDYFSNEDIWMQAKTLKNVCLGLSSITADAESIPGLLKESDIAVNTCFINSSCNIFEFRKPDFGFVNILLAKVTASLDLNRIDELKDIMENIPDQFAFNSLGIEEAAYMWNQIVAYTSKKFTGSLIHSELTFSGYDDIVNKFINFKTLCEHLVDILSSLYDKVQTPYENSSTNESFKQLLNHINGNYHRELYLKELANAYHINFTYCCDLFKKITGGTFSQFVTSLRMKKASELLLYTSLSLEEICKETGFNDYYYFNNVFKKQTGNSPAKYRKMNCCKDVTH